MKTSKNILIAFLLNITFSIFEFIGGIFTNSIAIISDAIHDMGDALSIGLSYFLEKKSTSKPDNKYTYGYARYSVLGAFITTTILTIGSIFVIISAIKRIINPVNINYNGMIIFAIVGVVINFLAAYFTKDGNSINQKSVNLHMLEDVLGWIVVLIGSILMKFTDITLLDSIMSIGVAVFIFINSLNNFKDILNLFLVKTPTNLSIPDLQKHLLIIDGVENIHHIHLWSLDGTTNYATMHIKTKKKETQELKKAIRQELSHHNITHVTLEIENVNEECEEEKCSIKNKSHIHIHHH